MIYAELQDRSQIKKVLGLGTAASALLYILIGVFGYLTFVNDDPKTTLAAKNILEAPYPESSLVMIIGHYCLMIAVISAAPIIVLPAKDSVTEVFPWAWQYNVTVTFLIVTLCYTLAVFIPNIGDAMTLVGSTTNPALGFVLPMIFYWKVVAKEPAFSWRKVRILLTLSFIIIVSNMSLLNFALAG
jgi:solute carrier family 36 (proton-coupled amino acid transporter)